MSDKIKNYILLALIIISVIEGILLKCSSPKIITETKTVESQYWKEQFSQLKTTYEQYVQKNIKTVENITKLYDENGKLKSEITKRETTDISKIDTAKTSTSTTTITEAAKVIEKEVIKFAVYPVEVSAGGTIDIAPLRFDYFNHVDVKYFWLSNNIGSGFGYNWQYQRISADFITLRF